MSSDADASAAAAAAIAEKTIALGYDLLSLKRYWIAITSLWVYEYLLTITDEVQYIWKEKKNLVFWLFFFNRYLCFIIIVITNLAYFTSLFNEKVYAALCIICFELNPELLSYQDVIALVSVRVYALSGRKKYIIFIAAAIILAQWCLLLYQDADYVNGTSDVALLLFARELDTSQLPTLPNIDAYRICIAIPGTEDITIGSTFLSLYIVYDGLAVLAIIYFVMQQAKGFRNAPILHLIQRDGLLFFAVMFSSNFVWLMTALHSSRPGLRFIQNQPAMVISSIMVNRITVNLKKAGGELVVVTWSGGENQLITHDGSITAPREDIELASYTPNNQDLKFARNYGCGSKNSHGEHGYKNNSSNVPTDYRN